MNRTRTTLLGGVALAMLGACGSDAKASPPAPSAAQTPPAADAPAVDAGGLGRTAVQLEGDPCALLTLPEIEGALGTGVEQGGFGDDLPGRCTYSIGGDVGAGVVQITLQDPLECNAVLKALAADSLDGTNAVRVDLGDGALYLKDSQVVVTTGGGCVAVGGSKSGVSLGQEMLVALATKVLARVG